MTQMRATFTPAGAARRRRWLDECVTDPLLRIPRAAQMLGPMNLPSEGFDDRNVARILALA